jgi:hypothetical protein
LLSTSHGILKAGVWFRRARLLIVSPDSRANFARRQAETPLIAPFRLAGPALSADTAFPKSSWRVHHGGRSRSASCEARTVLHDFNVSADRFLTAGGYGSINRGEISPVGSIRKGRR